MPVSVVCMFAKAKEKLRKAGIDPTVISSLEFATDEETSPRVCVLYCAL